MLKLIMLTWLVTQIYAPSVIEGGEPIFVFQLRPMFFANQQLCIKAIRLNKEYNVWKNAALARGLASGTIVKVRCPPYTYEFVVERNTTARN